MSHIGEGCADPKCGYPRVVGQKVKDFYHRVMGADYHVKFGSKKNIGMSEDNMGECRCYAREILVHTDPEDCSEKELTVRTKEIIAHELFHAYANEAGLDLDPRDEERVATFFMKNFNKMYESIEELYSRCKLGI